MTCENDGEIVCRDIIVRSGDTITESFSMLDDNTGYTARMQVREYPGHATSLLELTEGAGITLGGLAKTVDVLITPAQSLSLVTALPPDSGTYDIEVTSPGGVVTTIAHGDIVAEGDVSRT
jgi:hypothetical protein